MLRHMISTPLKGVVGNTVIDSLNINLLKQCARCCSSSNPSSDSFSVPLSENDRVNPEFINRNPRNLERMTLARKQRGWRFENPRRNYWYKVTFDFRGGFWAKVIHCSGEVVVKVSAKEFALSKFLFSVSDKTAAKTVAQVLAQRCKECGLSRMIVDPEIEDSVPREERLSAFVEQLEAEGISLEEPFPIVPAYSPGIDYDDEEGLAELRRRQERVHNLGQEHQMALDLGPTRQKHKKPAPPQNFDPVKDMY